MEIEFRDLKWAITASQHRSLRQAADSLNVRQSTLSRRLRTIEELLGGALFDRTNGGTRATIAGQEFLDAARRLIEEADLVVERFRTRACGQTGHLTIGVHASLSAGNLRATLIDHRSRFPQVETRLVDGASDHLFADLAHGSIDVAFVAEDHSRWSGNSLAVWSERVLVALPQSHPLAGQPVVYWGDLKPEPLLLPQRGPGAQLLKLLVKNVGCPDSCRIQRHDVSLDRFLTLVGAEFGVLLALEGATGAAFPGVVFREVHDAGGATRLNFRAYWRDGSANPSLRPFLNILRERYPDLSAGPEKA